MRGRTLAGIRDSELRQDVIAELDWRPSANTDISVAVKDGIVTLSGKVSSYRKKLTADRVVTYLEGVRAVINNLEVTPPAAHERTDADIAKAVVNALAWRVDIPSERITVTVEDGGVTLDGEVDWDSQRTSAEGAVQHVKGVTSVTNRIKVKHRVTAGDVRARIVQELLLSALRDAEEINAEVRGGKVILRGTVRAWPQKEEAERAARAVLGVTEVENNLRFALRS